MMSAAAFIPKFQCLEKNLPILGNISAPLLVCQPDVQCRVTVITNAIILRLPN
jgi:hypothetical protein